MKRLFVAAGGLMLFGAGWCFGQAEQRQHGNDGNSWHLLPSVARTFYIKGFDHGYTSALWQTTSLAMSKDAPEKVSSMKPGERKDYEESLRWANRIVPFELDGPPKSVRELEEVLNTSTATIEIRRSAWTKPYYFPSHHSQETGQLTKS
jgi:hypothetical protein